MTSFTYFPAAMKQVVNEPRGGVETTLLFWATKAQNRTKERLSSPYAPGQRSRFQRGAFSSAGHYTNPPPGPPKKRSGDLVDSIRVGSPYIAENGLIAVPVNSVAVHRGTNYSQWLRDEGYVFIRPEQIVA
jgi:hypothetical protein